VYQNSNTNVKSILLMKLTRTKLKLTLYLSKFLIQNPINDLAIQPYPKKLDLDTQNFLFHMYYLFLNVGKIKTIYYTYDNFIQNC